MADLVKAGVAIFEIAIRYRLVGFKKLAESTSELAQAKSSGAAGN
jgi:hypothetical protein